MAVAVSKTPETAFDGAKPSFAVLLVAVFVERINAVVFEAESINTGSDEL